MCEGYKIFKTSRREMQECQKVVTNIARLLKLCQADVPYHSGCDRPMLGQSLPATFCELRAPLQSIAKCEKQVKSDTRLVAIPQ